MKKKITLILLVLLGGSLILMNGFWGSWADRFLFHPQVRLSQAFALLEQGRLEEHEKALKEYVLTGGGPTDLRAIAFYNLGSYSLRKAIGGDQASGKDAYFYFSEALRNDPMFFPAKVNLEILSRQNQEKKPEEQEESNREESGSRESDEEQSSRGPTISPPFLGSTP